MGVIASPQARCGLQHARSDADASIYHGVRVPDPYRWLEDAKSEEVQKWSAAQNLQTREFLDRLPLRQAIKKQVETLSAGLPPRYRKLHVTKNGYFAMYVWFALASLARLGSTPQTLRLTLGGPETHDR